MRLITRQGKGSKLTIQEMDGNLTYLELLAKNGNFRDPREYILSKSTISISSNYSPSLPTFNLLETGEYILNNEDLLFPEDEIYVLASIETYLKFAEAASGFPGYLNNRKINVAASIETYLKFWEASIILDNQYNYNPQNGFVEQFLELINDPTYAKEGELFRKSDFLNLLLDTGIVELGQIGEGSKLAYSHILKKLIFDISGNITSSILFIYDAYGKDNDPVIRTMFKKILDLGIVVREYKGNLIVSSIETYLKWQEAEPGFPDYIEIGGPA